METYYHNTQHEVKPNIDIMIGTALVVTQIALRMMCLYSDTNGRLGRRYLPTTELRLRQAQSKILANSHTCFQSDLDDSQLPYTESMSDGTVNKALDAIEAIKKSKTEEDAQQFLLNQRIEAGFGRELSKKHTDLHRIDPTHIPRFGARQPVVSALPTTATAGTSSRTHEVLPVPHHHHHSKLPVKTIGAVRMDHLKTENPPTDHEKIDTEAAQVHFLNAAKSSSTGRLVSASLAAAAARITAAKSTKVNVSTLPMSPSVTNSLHKLTLGPDPMHWLNAPSKRKVPTTPESEEIERSQNAKPSPTKDIKKTKLKKNTNANDGLDSKDIPTTSRGRGVKISSTPYPSLLTPVASDQRLRKPEIGFSGVSDESLTENVQKSSETPGKDSVISYKPLEIYASKDQEEQSFFLRKSIETAKSFINRPKSNQCFVENKSGQRNVDGGLLTMTQSSGGLLDQTIMTRCQLPFSSQSDKSLGSAVSENVDERQQIYPTPPLTDEASQVNTSFATGAEVSSPQGGGRRMLLADDMPYDKLVTTTLSVKKKKRIFYNRLLSANNEPALATSVASAESVQLSPLDTDKNTITLTQSAKSSLTISNVGSALKFVQTDESLLSFEGGVNSYFSMQETGNSVLHADQSDVSSLTTERSDNRSLSIGDSSGITYYRSSSPVDSEGSKEPAQNKEKTNNTIKSRWYNTPTAKKTKIKTVVDHKSNNLDNKETQNDSTGKQENGIADSPEQEPEKKFHFSKESNRDLSLVVRKSKYTPPTKKILLANDQNGHKSCNESCCSVTATSSGSGKSEESKRAPKDRDCGVVGYKSKFPSPILGVPNGRVLLPGLRTAVDTGEIESPTRQLGSSNTDSAASGYTPEVEITRQSGKGSRTETQGSYVSRSDFSSEVMFDDSKTSTSSIFSGLPGTKSGRHSYPESFPINSESKTGRSSLPLKLSKTPYGGAPLIGVKFDRYKEPFPRSRLGNKGLVANSEESTTSDLVTTMGPGFSRINTRPFSLIQNTPNSSADVSKPDSTSDVLVEPVSSSRHLIVVGSTGLSIDNRNSTVEANENQIRPEATLLPGSGSSQLAINKSNTSCTSGSVPEGVKRDNEPIDSNPTGRRVSQLVKSMGFFVSSTSLQQPQQSDRLAQPGCNVGSTSATDPKPTIPLTVSLTSGLPTINRQISSENLLKEQMLKYNAPQEAIPLVGSNSGLARQFKPSTRKRWEQRQHSSSSDSSCDGSETKSSLCTLIFVKDQKNTPAIRKTIEDSGTQKSESNPATTTGKPIDSKAMEDQDRFDEKAVEHRLPCTKTPAELTRGILVEQEVGGASYKGCYGQTVEDIATSNHWKTESSERRRSPNDSTVAIPDKFEATNREKAQPLRKENAQSSSLDKQLECKAPTDEGKSTGQPRSDSEGFLGRKFSSGLRVLIGSASFIPTVTSIIRAPRVFLSSQRLNDANNRRDAALGRSTEQMETAKEVSHRKCSDSSESEESLA